MQELVDNTMSDMIVTDREGTGYNKNHGFRRVESELPIDASSVGKGIYFYPTMVFIRKYDGEAPDVLTCRGWL